MCSSDLRIFQGRGTQVLNRGDARCMAMALPGRSSLTFGLDAPDGAHWGIRAAGGGPVLCHGEAALLPVSELPVVGLHNAANALAAGALCAAIGVPDSAMPTAWRAFRGLPHRVEHVADIAGVACFNDSKGTNVGSTVAALSGMDRPIVLIAGGDGKGQDFSPLAPAVAARARAVVLIGRDVPLIDAALSGSGVPLHRALDMEQAVAQALALARPGDAVLLSPACASYDMFRSYVHRGETFSAIVRNLAEPRQ